jgi:multicomponent Na+:H+ antiporter subunit D
VEGAAGHAGSPLSAWAILLASSVSGAAILHAGARIFLGMGPSREPEPAEEDLVREEKEERGARFSFGMPMVAGLLVLGALAVGVLPLRHAVRRGAETFADRTGYAAEVLEGARPLPKEEPLPRVEAKARAMALGSVALAFFLAWVGLYRSRFPRGLQGALDSWLEPVSKLLRRLQSGRLTDDVTWIAVGLASYGGLLAWWVGLG